MRADDVTVPTSDSLHFVPGECKYMALDCSIRKVKSQQVLFSRRWLPWHIFQGPDTVKQAETNRSGDRIHHLSTTSRKTINKEKQKQKFSLHYIINVSMRACRRWRSGEMEQVTFKPMVKLQKHNWSHFCIFICAGCWHKHITVVWSDSSTKSTAYKQKERTIAMVLVLHGFQLSK